MFEYKDLIPIFFCFFALFATAAPLKTVYKSLHSTKNLMKKNINNPWLFKLET